MLLDEPQVKEKKSEEIEGKKKSLGEGLRAGWLFRPRVTYGINIQSLFQRYSPGR